MSEPSVEIQEAAARRKGLLRRLYDWVLHWAETPYGGAALFVNAFAESSFFPIPPDALLIAMCIGQSKRSYRFAFWCSVASVLGGAAGYWIGFTAWGVAGPLFFKYVPSFTPQAFAHVGELYENYNFWVVFTAGFTPIPYKLITIGAGVFEINFGIFMVASVLSRSARFFLVAALIRKFGPVIKSFIDRYFNLLSVIFMVLLAGGFLVFKYVVR
ncbi:MAG: cytochrome B [Candidatus Glassbacteria bacterium RIFCSPLOWO2_12_FULL_58_11]|uniref:Cytochrome B n=1 Tax=Candidatus Glassbacteria bacterium RIFCSPLOWO2_12_FULL_58_11 TaxID=1817867 RepID=A0A1F5YPY2_9BACT|nr:MAG: cytochrome B [Candidatus Glassbacteria bacterium RIFCSPLOWO2_12_FULL_58_11]